MHKQILELIEAITKHGIKSSIITNGAALEKKAPDLAKAGLGQLIVSIDGLKETHDRLRGTVGLYDRCIDGLRASAANGIMLRVNSVVGPDNFRDMPSLQDILTDLGVVQWEMSSLKLGKKLDYTFEDRCIIETEIVPKMFIEAAAKGSWFPGNVRELSNCMERAVALAQYEQIVPADLPDKVRAASGPVGASAEDDIVPLEEVERRAMLRAFERLGRNKSLTAQALGVDRKTLYRKLERWGVLGGKG